MTPDSARVEAAILGAVLLDNEVWPQTASLEPGDFSLSANGIIYSRMRDLLDSGRPVDMITLSVELEQHSEVEAIGGVEYLSSLIDGVVERPSIAHYVKIVRSAAGARAVAHGTEAICELARKGLGVPELRARLADLDRVVGQYESSNSAAPIRGFDSVPNLLTMQIDPMDYVVQGLVPRRSLTLWTGTDGTAKTFLAQKMAVAVSTGGRFLAQQCRNMPVLYLDYENPNFVVRQRLELMGAEPNNPNLKVWGTWLAEQPPQVGNQLLPTIAKAVQPLIILDPFRYAHGAEENDSTEMMTVMKDLRACVVAGATVIVFHHPAKTEGSTGRGSSAIRGAVDLAYLQELSDETGLITLRCVKNRFGERPVLTIRPDFDEGTFEITDSPRFTKKMADIDALSEIINDPPWQSQKAIVERWGGNMQMGIQLLKEYSGSRWQMVKEGRSFRYGPTVQENCTVAVPTVPKESPQGRSEVRYNGTHPLGVYRVPYPPPQGNTKHGTEPKTPPELVGSEASPVCHVHPQNTTKWWTRPDRSKVCGLCHPN